MLHTNIGESLNIGYAHEHDAGNSSSVGGGGIGGFVSEVEQTGFPAKPDFNNEKRFESRKWIFFSRDFENYFGVEK